jgi:DNA-binding GntR family transcriptional regulator
MAKTAKRPVGRPKGTGSQQIYDELRGRILRLKLSPGVDLNENDLVEEFGVSRTPVREALIRLTSDGFVRMLPNRGARVMPLDVDEVPELFEALELCMRATTRWAAVRRTDGDLEELRRLGRAFAAAADADDFFAMSDVNKDFHMAVAACGGNRFVTKLYEILLSDSLRLANLSLSAAISTVTSHKEYFAEIVAQHERIIDLIAKGDAEGADELAGAHARKFRDRLLHYMKNSLANDVRVEAIER